MRVVFMRESGYSVWAAVEGKRKLGEAYQRKGCSVIHVLAEWKLHKKAYTVKPQTERGNT